MLSMQDETVADEKVELARSLIGQTVKGISVTGQHVTGRVIGFDPKPPVTRQHGLYLVLEQYSTYININGDYEIIE
jgi:hypothetical protein